VDKGRASSSKIKASAKTLAKGGKGMREREKGEEDDEST
jgi:hypothetical protein